MYDRSFQWRMAAPIAGGRNPMQLGVDDVVADPAAYQKEMLMHARRQDKLAIASVAMVGVVFALHVCGLVK